MKKDFKVKTGFSTKVAMRKFTDCLNKAEIKLTFRDNVKNICTSKNIKEIDKQLMEYILNKLNEIETIVKVV